MATAIIYQESSKRKRLILNVVIFLLLVLWVPVSIDKILNFPIFKTGILTQPFSNQIGYILIYTLPVLEILIVLMLVSEKMRKIGLILSTTLMIAFTGYITVALLGAWEKLPCGCGSVINGMNWTQHFFFNMIFLILSLVGLYLLNKLRDSNAVSETVKGESAKRHIKNIL